MLNNFSKREQLMLALIAVMALGLIAVVYDKYFSPEPEIAFKLEENPAVSVMAPIEEEAAKIVVYVTGAVKFPGVYALEEGARVKDAIDIAGGALPDADLLRLNLAQRLYDEDMLYVFRVGEGEEEVGALGASTGVSSSGDAKVNINTADQKTLETLPGIGAVTAEKIIDYREQNGPFKKIEDIKKVSGIGDKKFEQLQDKIKVR